MSVSRLARLRWRELLLSALGPLALAGLALGAAERAGDEGELELHGFEGAGTQSGNVLAFEARFSLSPFEKIVRLVQRLAAGKPGPWGDPWGYIGPFLVYGLLVSLLCRWIHGRGSAE